MHWLKRIEGEIPIEGTDKWGDPNLFLEACLIKVGGKHLEFKMPGTYSLRKRLSIGLDGRPELIGWSLIYKVSSPSIRQIGRYIKTNGSIFFPINDNSFLNHITHKTFPIGSYQQVKFDINQSGDVNVTFI